MSRHVLTLLIFLISASAFAQPQADATVQDTVKIKSQLSQEQENLTTVIQETQPEWSISVGKIFWALIVFLIGFIIIKYLTRLLELMGERWNRFRLSIMGFIPIIRITGWTFVAYIIIADIFAPPIATLVALTASAGIAIGFASQDILKNIFGGVMILFDRPFQVGDKIEIGSYYGEVISIGLRTVRIVTPDDSQVAIPNSEIVNQSVSNANVGESNCQVVAEFYLPANIDIARVKKIAYRAAVVSRYIYLNKPVAVIFKNEIHEGRSMLKMRLKAYVLDIRYEFPFASEMTEIVIDELLKQKLLTVEDLSFSHYRNMN